MLEFAAKAGLKGAKLWNRQGGDVDYNWKYGEVSLVCFPIEGEMGSHEPTPDDPSSFGLEAAAGLFD